MRTRVFPWRIALATVSAGLLIAAMQAGGMSASASMRADDVPYTFSEPSAVSIEYGQPWEFYAESASMVGYFHNTSVVVSDAPSYKTNVATPEEGTFPHHAWAYVWPSTSQPPLDPGTYKITVISKGGWHDAANQNEDNYVATTDIPASLVIAPAKIDAEVTVLGDPNNSRAAIITTRFTGRFVDEYSMWLGDPAAPLTPAGTWSVKLTDPEGDVVLERSVERPATDTQFATTFYWTEGEPGTEYDVEASFTSDGATAARFALTPASAFSYTSSENVRPVPTSTAEAADLGALETAGFALPLWSVVLLGLILAGLGGLVALSAVRLRGPRANPIDGGVADDTAS